MFYENPNLAHAVSKVKLANNSEHLFAYDLNGNLTQGPSFKWQQVNNVWQRVFKATRNVGVGLNDKPERIDQSLTAADRAHLRFDYGPGDELIVQLSETQSKLQRTVYAGGFEVLDTLGSNGTVITEHEERLTVAGVAVVLKKRTTAAPTLVESCTFLLRDHLGSVTAVVSEAKAVI